MRTSRCRIAWLMALVAIAALTCGAIRIFSDYDDLHSARFRASDYVLLGLGVLPMASFLGVGLLIAHRRRGYDRFVLGFETFGVVAVALYIDATIRFRTAIVLPYLALAEETLRMLGIETSRIIRPAVATPELIITYGLISLWVSVPQLVFALIGGFLSRNLRIR